MSTSNPYDPTSQLASSSAAAAGRRKLHLKSMDVLSAGKLLGVFYGLLGLVVGVFMALMAVIGMLAGGQDAMLGGAITGIGAVILLPLIYGVGGFLGGVIGALLYNLVAGLVGGFVFEVEM